jgi:hypothetical protein
VNTLPIVGGAPITGGKTAGGIFGPVTSLIKARLYFIDYLQDFVEERPAIIAAIVKAFILLI